MPLELRRKRAVDPERGDDHAIARPARGVRHRYADRLIELVPLRRGLDPEPFGRAALERASDQCSAGEVLVGGAALRGPRLEDTGGIDDQHPVRPRLRPQLVGLVEQVGAIVGAEGFPDAGHVRGHLDQGGGELAKAPAPAHERVADRGAGRPKGARRRDLRRGLGARSRHQQGGTERRHHHQGRAGEDLGAEWHPQYLRPCWG